jgi:hypothetical protein
LRRIPVPTAKTIDRPRGENAGEKPKATRLRRAPVGRIVWTDWTLQFEPHPTSSPKAIRPFLPGKAASAAGA